MGFSPPRKRGLWDLAREKGGGSYLPPPPHLPGAPRPSVPGWVATERPFSAPCLCLPPPPRRSEQMASLPSLHTNQGAPRPSWRRGLVGSALLSQEWSAPIFRPWTPSSLGFCCHIRHLPHLALPSQPPSPIQRSIGEGHALRCHQAGPRVQPVPWVHTQGMTAPVRPHSSSEDKANWNPSLWPLVRARCGL